MGANPAKTGTSLTPSAKTEAESTLGGTRTQPSSGAAPDDAQPATAAHGEEEKPEVKPEPLSAALSDTSCARPRAAETAGGSCQSPGLELPGQRFFSSAQTCFHPSSRSCEAAGIGRTLLAADGAEGAHHTYTRRLDTTTLA